MLDTRTAVQAPRGVITYANDVFLRVSAYDMHEVVGRPHNLIRHPEMPRALDKLLWDALGDGREIFPTNAPLIRGCCRARRAAR